MRSLWEGAEVVEYFLMGRGNALFCCYFTKERLTSVRTPWTDRQRAPPSFVPFRFA